MLLRRSRVSDPTLGATQVQASLGWQGGQLLWNSAFLPNVSTKTKGKKNNLLEAIMQAKQENTAAFKQDQNKTDMKLPNNCCKAFAMKEVM